jgi:hypothetical protein
MPDLYTIAPDSKVLEYLNDVLYKPSIIKVFINFLVRDGWTHQQANKEIDFLFQNNRVVLKEHYLRTRRIGSTRLLNRAEQHRVYRSLENACNHVLFGLEDSIK